MERSQPHQRLLLTHFPQTTTDRPVPQALPQVLSYGGDTPWLTDKPASTEETPGQPHGHTATFCATWDYVPPMAAVLARLSLLLPRGRFLISLERTGLKDRGLGTQSLDLKLQAAAEPYCPGTPFPLFPPLSCAPVATAVLLSDSIT